MVKPEDVTIIIPHLGATKESRYSLQECLKSLNETVPNSRKIVAFNGWVPGSDYQVGDIALIDQGQCKAVNAAVATTNTPWIFVTNDDMIYAPGWFERLTNHSGNRIMCISPQLVEPRSGAPTFEVFPCGGAGGDFDKQKWLDYAKNYKDKGLRNGFNLPLLIKRELWDTVEGYDINYDPWGSNGDSDLEYKIRLAGIQPFQNTCSQVYHFGQTSGTFHPDQRPYWQKNWHYFIEKWGFERASSPEIWTADFKIPETNKYHPNWEGTYED